MWIGMVRIRHDDDEDLMMTALERIERTELVFYSVGLDFL